MLLTYSSIAMRCGSSYLGFGPEKNAGAAALLVGSSEIVLKTSYRPKDPSDKVASLNISAPDEEGRRKRDRYCAVFRAILRGLNSLAA
jgi:hypothetical protein